MPAYSPRTRDLTGPLMALAIVSIANLAGLLGLGALALSRPAPVAPALATPTTPPSARVYRLGEAQTVSGGRFTPKQVRMDGEKRVLDLEACAPADQLANKRMGGKFWMLVSESGTTYFTDPFNQEAPAEPNVCVDWTLTFEKGTPAPAKVRYFNTNNGATAEWVV